MPKGLGVTVSPLTAGMREDMETLYASLSGDQWRYVHFRAAFVDHRFDLIFGGTVSSADARDFNEKLLSMALMFVVGGGSDDNESGGGVGQWKIHRNVFGVYLLYALFCLQPSATAMKIRITPQQAMKMVELRRYLGASTREVGADAVKVLAKLMQLQAFEVVAFPDEHNPLNFRRFSEPVDCSAGHRRNDDALVEFENGELMQKLRRAAVDYGRAKAVMFGETTDTVSMVTSPTPIDDLFRNARERVKRGGIGLGADMNRPKVDLDLQQSFQSTTTNRSEESRSLHLRRHQLRMSAATSDVRISRKYNSSIEDSTAASVDLSKDADPKAKKARAIKKKKQRKTTAKEDGEVQKADRVLAKLTKDLAASSSKRRKVVKKEEEDEDYVEEEDEGDDD